MYLAAVFSDLEKHSIAWGQAPRDHMVSLITDYRHLAEKLAGQYGSRHFNFTGDGHLFLYESADVAVQFSLQLIEAWKHRFTDMPETADVPDTPLRVGCHFGECVQLNDVDAWVGRAINLAKRVEDSAKPNRLYVTESVLELVDLPLYRFEDTGFHSLKGDHLPQRALYRVIAMDELAVTSKRDDELTAEAWYLKGVRLIGTDAENTDKEAACYREALRLRADYPEAHNSLAVVLRALGDETAASEHYREALRLRPAYPEAHYNYAILLEGGGSIAGAVEHYETALQLRPGFADAHHSYANLLKHRGDLSAADEHYKQAMLLRPTDPKIHSNYAILLEDRDDVEGAARHYQDALRLAPDDAEAHYNFALLLDDSGQSDAAGAHYREALRVWPDYPEAHNNLAVLLHVRGGIEEAARHYGEALRLRPNDPETHYNFALLLKAQGKVSKAQEHFRIAHELAPEVPTFRSMIDAPKQT